MLSKNPLMIDLNINQWRNLHSLFLEPIRSKERITVIHEKGKILNISHSLGKAVETDYLQKIIDPEYDTKIIYEKNKQNTDLVIMIDRLALEKYYNEAFSYWTTEMDLDEYVINMYKLLDKYYPDIIIYPGPSSKKAGLQSKGLHDMIFKIVQFVVSSGSTIVFCIFEDNSKIFTSLILGIDDHKKISLVTSVNQEIISNDWRKEYSNVLSWIDESFWECDLGIFMNKSTLDRIMKNQSMEEITFNAILNREIIVDPFPKPLQSIVKKYKLHDLT